MDVLGHLGGVLWWFGTFWIICDVLGGVGRFFVVLGHNRTLRVVFGRFWMFWDYYSFDRTFRISKNLGGPRQPSSINHCSSSIIHHPLSITFCIQKYQKVSKSIPKELKVA